MTAPADLVFLVDVDNTLLDNDPVGNDIRRHLQELGRSRARRAVLGNI